MELTEIWNNALLAIEKNISSGISYNIHIKSAAPISYTPPVFTISVPTAINKNIIEYRHKKLIEAVLEQTTGTKITLKILTDEEAAAKEEPPAAKPSFNPVTSLDDVNPKYTFDNFVVGSSNNVAYEASKRSAEYPGQLDNPLFIYGNSGLGKTHLMHAIGNKIKEKYSDIKILCVTCERFTNEYVTSIREKKMDSFRAKYRSPDVLLVDDVQFLENKEGVQEEFFHTFNELFSLGKQIVLTSDRKPGELKTLTTRMRTRFGQGFTIDVSLPNYETRIAILQKKAEDHYKQIDDESLNYIAEHVRTSIRELEGALLNVISKSEISKSEINLTFVKRVLSDYISDESSIKMNPKTIIQKVAIYYNISENEITGKIKTKDIALPRQVAMYLCRKMLGLNDTTISREFSKDRTTVKHNIEKIEGSIDTNEEISSAIAYITKDIQTNRG